MPLILKLGILVIGVIVLKRRVSNIRENKRVIKSVSATLAFEGLKPSRYAKAVGKQYLENKISSNEAVAKVKERYTSKLENKNDKKD